MSKPTVVHITSWYPNQTDPQLGIFVQKHILKTYSFADNIVLAIIPSLDQRQIAITEQITDTAKVIIGYYPAVYGKFFRNYRNYTSCLSKMLNTFLEYNIAPDMIHCHTADKSVKIAMKVFKNTPFIVTEHWSGYLNGGFESLKPSKQKKRIFELNKAESILTVSPDLKVKFEKIGVNTPIQLVDNVIEVTKIKQHQNNVLRFLMIADLVDEVKNISGVIKAFEKHLTTHPNHTLSIIGGGKDLQDLEELVSALKLETFILFKGRMPNTEVLDAYSNYDVLVVNSFLETYSMVTAEALMCGLPVISTKCGGPEQFIQEGINGILIDVESESQLISAMTTLYNNKNSYQPEKVRASVTNRFSISKIEQIHKKTVSEVLDTPLT